MLGSELVERSTPPATARAQKPDRAPIVELRQVVKTFETPAGTFTALKGVDMRIFPGEFVAVIGKSGSGKSTIINMITGIDRPSSGEVIVDGTPVHALSEGQLARWRGKSLGVVFQFFQLLPTLTVLENVLLPMDFCNAYPPRERRERGMYLLEQVGLADRADKLPSAISGGQQQRAAIARALANDPPIIVADEPTGNLDSKTAESIFRLFEALVQGGKTIVMVTHDNDLARRAKRSIIVADGEVVNEYVVEALSTLDVDQMTFAASKLRPRRYAPGSVVVRQGDLAEHFYIITDGSAEVFLEHPGGQEILVNRLSRGHYFGEMALLHSGRRAATVRAAQDGELEVMALDRDTFSTLMQGSEVTREALDRAVQARLSELARAGAPAAPLGA